MALTPRPRLRSELELDSMVAVLLVLWVLAELFFSSPSGVLGSTFRTSTRLHNLTCS